MRVAVLACALGACAYQPGSFQYYRQTFPGQRVTVGCLDLAVQRRVVDGGAVLEYQFANRCDHQAVIDLAGARVVARSSGGEEVPLAPYDPNGEIHRAWIDGRRTGAETIAYGADDQHFSQVWVDAASIAAAPGGEHWLCFAGASL